jgi:DNA-binding transcriptional LysR family regulator
MWLGQVAGRVLKSHPRLNFKLHVEHWRLLPDLLRQGRVDLFVANVDEILNHKEFHIVELPSMNGIWVCRAVHPLAKRKLLSRASLKDYPFIGPQLPAPIRDWLVEGTNTSSILDRKIETTSVTLIKAMVREGNAISLVHPDMVRAELAGGEFVQLELNSPTLLLRAGVVWLSGRSPLPAALAFVRELLIEVGLDPDLSLR